MCGIAGYILNRPARSARDVRGLLSPMLRHRGPDDEGVCLISRKGPAVQAYRTDRTVYGKPSELPHLYDEDRIIEHDIALAHTRYAIIDLTPGGHQPFFSGDGSVAAIFNGEIYNYVELRQELSAAGVGFRTASDTEVLVEGYRAWGRDLWNRLNGFWAVALYDLNRGEMVLSRDRIGVAPLYYRETGEGLFFASYIQPLLDIFSPGAGMDRDAAMGFLQTGFKDLDHSTFYSGIKTVPARSAFTFRQGQNAFSQAEKNEYWDFPSRRLEPSQIPFSEAVEKFRETFFDAVRIRLRSDIKLAFELSGGLDSSSAAAAAAVLRNNDVTTYTVKVRGADEEPYARTFLKKYPVDYRVLRDLEEDFTREHPFFTGIMEEPYDNPGSYNHYKMLKVMKWEGVGVVVGGAGGDEALAGYETSFWPAAYREMKSGGILSYMTADWHEFVRRFRTLKNARDTLVHYAVAPFRRAAAVLSGSSPGASLKSVTKALGYRREYLKLPFTERVLFHYRVALVPYYMRSTDHYTMGIPMEHRFPFVDYRIIELGLSMPASYLFRNGWTKYLLRKAMEPYLPREILWRRKKMGFPFAYRRYLKANRKTFEPYLPELEKMGLQPGDRPVYGHLLKKDPRYLWRLLSAAIWGRYVLNK